ncbi:MAG: discoidin domain-containing protein [Myxococcales bacterium]|nr:discoidin domain-containing protein [Myxococcales bacterium]
MSQTPSDFRALRRVFETAEGLAGDTSREAQEARLWQYRFVLDSARRSSANESKVPAEPAMTPSAPLQPPVEAVGEAAPTPSEPLTTVPTTPESAAVTVTPTTEPAAPSEVVAPSAAPVLEGASLDAAVLEARRLASEALQVGDAQPSASHRRVTRGATLFAIVFAVLVFVVPMLLETFEPADLAKGKPWRTSSSMFTCHPDSIECGGARTTILFHTQEDAEPWFLIDLGAPTAFRSATVVNRRDDGKERAVPLVLEVSDDEQTWRQVSRRDEVFKVWKPKFDAVTARFVRVRVARRSYLHLEAVRVHP